MSSKTLALLILTVFATACGRDNIRGRYEGHQTLQTTGSFSESLPLSIEITDVSDEGRITGQWLGDQGSESGRFFGLWDEDKTIEDATASINDPNVPTFYQRPQVAQPQPPQGPIPQDPNDVPAGVRGAANDTCFTNFTGNLNIDKGRITGSLRYDSNNPACPSDVMSRYVELNLVEEFEDDDD